MFFFPLEKKTGQDLASFARTNGLSEISGDVICRFFLEESHTLSILLEILRTRASTIFGQFFFSFTCFCRLRLLTITAEACGVYRNFGQGGVASGN